jgi:hypothetical protein
MLIIFDGSELNQNTSAAKISILGYQMSASGILSSGVICASGWLGSGNYGEWNVSGYDAYAVNVADGTISMTSELLSVPTRVSWVLQSEEL